MAAMLSAVDDSIGEIMAELLRLGQAEDTFTFFTSDNGPSRESRNWLDGTLDPYCGGTTGRLKGHKFSLYDGGIRVPGIVHWPARIRPGQVLTAPCASMDVFPTVLRASGGDPSDWELDGVDLLPYLVGGDVPGDRDIYWEMGDQTAVRRGDWKLVLNGQLVEGAPPEDGVHPSDFVEDLGERINLREAHPELAGELKHAAESWREELEQRWERELSAEHQGTVTHSPQA